MPGNITCPKCKVKMIPMVDVKQSHIWYEKCNTCHGTFLDAGEFKDLKNKTVLDIIKDVLTGERKI
ncbi:MAG: zf-TFIIB domain-containing protein [Spirochaetales bacterium]|nr:zf-TFIIB domain-containing protein [Spirochaetales bacterium]